MPTELSEHLMTIHLMTIGVIATPLKASWPRQAPPNQRLWLLAGN